MRVRADRAAEFADADPLARLREPFFRAAEFVEHQRELQTEGDRLGVNAVAAADHRRHFEPPRLVCRSLFAVTSDRPTESRPPHSAARPASCRECRTTSAPGESSARPGRPSQRHFQEKR